MVSKRSETRFCDSNGKVLVLVDFCICHFSKTMDVAIAMATVMVMIKVKVMFCFCFCF